MEALNGTTHQILFGGRNIGLTSRRSRWRWQFRCRGSRRSSAVAQLSTSRQPTMRKLLYILLATVALIAIRGYSLTETKNIGLSFYVVSEEKIDGGRFIDTLDFPKLGYIAARPDLIITQLASVSDSSSPANPSVSITIMPGDSQKFEALTKSCIGKQVLLMLDDTPLLAPRILAPVSTQSFLLTMSGHSDKKVIEDGLKKLIR